MKKIFRFSTSSLVILCLFVNILSLPVAQAISKTSSSVAASSDVAPVSVSAPSSGPAAFPVKTAPERSVTLTLTGKLKQFVVEPTAVTAQGDRPAPVQNPKTKFVLDGANDRHTQLVFDQRLFAFTNQQVRLTGVQLPSGEVAVNDVSLAGPVAGRVSSTPPPTVGSRKVLVLLTNFMNDLSEPTNSTEVRNSFYYAPNSANNFFKEASQYNFQLTGIRVPDVDVSPWAMLPMTNENCTTQMLEQWTTARDTIARQQGFNPPDYQSVVYMFPTIPGCTLGALGSMGELGASSGIERIYFQPATPSIGAIAHELGHNLGLQHASGYRCSSGNVPADCVSLDFGDRADFMAADYYLPNNYHRAQLGWIWGRTTEVTASGEYTLVPPTSFLPQAKLLKIPLKDPSGNLSGNSMWLETRKIGAFDDFSSSLFSAYKNGVAIRYGSDDLANQFSRPWLLDTTSSTTSYYDSPLLEGQSFTDTAAGVTITVTRGNSPAFGARVRVLLTR